MKSQNSGDRRVDLENFSKTPRCPNFAFFGRRFFFVARSSDVRSARARVSASATMAAARGESEGVGDENVADPEPGTQDRADDGAGPSEPVEVDVESVCRRVMDLANREKAAKEYIIRRVGSVAKPSRPFADDVSMPLTEDSIHIGRVIFESRHERTLVVLEVESRERSLERQSRIRNQFNRSLRIICAAVFPDVLIDVVCGVCEGTRRAERLATAVKRVRIVLLGEILSGGDGVLLGPRLGHENAIHIGEVHRRLRDINLMFCPSTAESGLVRTPRLVR